MHYKFTIDGPTITASTIQHRAWLDCSSLAVLSSCINVGARACPQNRQLYCCLPAPVPGGFFALARRLLFPG